MNEEELAQRLFLLHVAVMRHEYTDWPDGGDDRELMLGEQPMEENEKQPKDIGWWIVFGVWLLFGVLVLVVWKKVVAS